MSGQCAALGAAGVAPAASAPDSGVALEGRGFAVTVLVVSETHLVRGPQGHIYSRAGVDGYDFWRRYLDVFEHVVVAARTGPAWRCDDLLPVEGPGVRVAPLPEYAGPWGYLRIRRRLARAMMGALSEADVLCLRAPGPIAGLAWRRRGSRPFGIEVVGDPLDALSPGAVRSVARPLARRALTRELRRMCIEAEAVAYVTESALQRRYPTGSWSTSYSSIDLGAAAFVSDAEVARRVAAEWRVAKGTPANPWHLVSVASLTQLYKGTDVLIDAVARCRDRGLELTLTIVGDGRCRSALEARARARAVQAQVRFAGHLTAGAAVRAAIDRADLFVLASRSEGLPRAVIEAMARAVPCIGSRVGGMAELLPNERLVRPGDAGALADAITYFCSASTDFAAVAHRDLAVARRYHAGVLRPRRIRFYQRLRAAADAMCSDRRACLVAHG